MYQIMHKKNAQMIYNGACEIMYDNETLTSHALYEKIYSLLNNNQRLIEISKSLFSWYTRC